MRKFIRLNLLSVFFTLVFCASAFAQLSHSYFDHSMEGQAYRDISGLFKGSWTDLYNKKGELEMKIYAQYEDTYIGHLKLIDSKGKIHTGMVNLNLSKDYFNGYYSPSVYAADSTSTSLECQLTLSGKLYKEKKQYVLRGEGVSASCYENNILEMEIKEEKLLATVGNE
jgi:hypothetical protein